MSSCAPVTVNGHRVSQHHDTGGKSYWACQDCGGTEFSAASFNAYGCPGSSLRGADPVDKTAIQTRGEQ